MVVEHLMCKTKSHHGSPRMQMQMQADRQAGRHTDRLTNRRQERQRDRQTGRQTDRQSVKPPNQGISFIFESPVKSTHGTPLV